jgi:hypothetical protein
MTMRKASLTAAALLGLAACDSSGNVGGAARGICTPFASAAIQTVGGAASDASAGVDDCLHRWAYTLAKSTDPADHVAAAAVAACSGALSRWNQQNLVPPPGGDGAPEPLSLVTGQPTNAFAAHHEFSQGRALFYVVQARAGHCAAPPAPKGGYVIG